MYSSKQHADIIIDCTVCEAEGSGMEGVAMKCGRGQGWRVWPCSVGGVRVRVRVEGVAMQCGRAGVRVEPTCMSQLHNTDNNHTVTHDLFQFLDKYMQLDEGPIRVCIATHLKHARKSLMGFITQALGCE